MYVADKRLASKGLVILIVSLTVACLYLCSIVYFVQRLEDSLSGRSESANANNGASSKDSAKQSDLPTVIATIKGLVWFGFVLSFTTGALILIAGRNSFIVPLDHVLDNARKLVARTPLKESPQGSVSNEFLELDGTFQKLQTAIVALEEILNESKGRVRVLMESLPSAIVICSDQGIIDMTNTAAEQIFGYGQKTLSGSHISVLFTGNETAQRAVMDSLNENFVGRVQDLDAVKKDGGRVPVELSVSRFDIQGERKFLIVALDVSERRAVERLKQELMQMVSHDLRSPLTSICGGLEMLKLGTFGQLSEKALSTVDKCDYDIQRLINLIDELLDFEKIQSGKLKINYEVVEIGSVVKRAISAVSYLASKSEIEIVAPDSSIEAFADGAKLVQVTVNLLSNAIKFSPANSKISIESRESDNFIEVSISDQGRGIAPADQAKIFERFEQLEISDASEKKGKGLGLAICKAIIEGHGGSIGVNSKEGEGSTFWFRIPQPS